MSGKGRTEKTQKQDSAWSERGGKNEYLTLWEGEMWCTVTCGARDDNQSSPNPTRSMYLTKYCAMCMCSCTGKFKSMNVGLTLLLLKL